MTPQTTPQNPFAEGTVKWKVFQKHFIEARTPAQLAVDLGITESSAKWYIYKIKRQVDGAEAVVATPTNVRGVFECEIKNESNKLVLCVKTDADFENWLKKHKEVKTTENLWGARKTGKYYYLRFINNPAIVDDVNLPVLNHGHINFAILRIPGISDGLKYEIDSLMTEKQFATALKELVKVYKNFYSTSILKSELKMKGEILVEND